MEDDDALAEAPHIVEPSFEGWRVVRFVNTAICVLVNLFAVWLYAIAPDHPWREGTIQLLCGYAIVVLVFACGVRWALAFSASSRPRADFAIAGAAAGAAPLILFFPPATGFAVLAVMHAASGAWDSLAVHEGVAPYWYGRLRALQTVMVMAALLLGFIATS